MITYVDEKYSYLFNIILKINLIHVDTYIKYKKRTKGVLTQLKG